MKTTTSNLLLNTGIKMKSYLFGFVFLFLGLVQVNADCTIDTAATGGDNIMTGAELLTFINSNNCTGTLTIEAPVDIILSSTITIPNTIDRIVIKNGGQILWATNNVALNLAENTAIVIENTSNIGSTTGAIGSTTNSCSNTKRIWIGSVEYSACEGGGQVCVIFADLIQNGGTIQIDPDFAVISGSDNEVCFGPTDIAIELNGYVEGTPQYEWSKISGPGTVTFSPNNAATTTVTASIPGTYTLRISVTVPLSDSCTTTFVTVYNDIEIEFREGLGATTLATTPGGGGTCNLNVDFSASTTNGGANLTYLWDFADGNTSTAMNPSHTYATSGTYNVSLTVTDPDGTEPCNVIVVNQEVIITDNPPSITAPTPLDIEGCDISVAPAPETTVAGLETIGFIISDDATGDSDLIVGSSDSLSGTCPIVITRTYTITDDCGNMSQADQIINITDTTPPSWTTVANTLDRTVECSNAQALIDAQALVPTASDLCDNSLTPIKTIGSFVVGSCPNTGTYTNTWTVFDDCNNEVLSVYTQTITVQDTTPPTVPVNASSTVQCLNDAVQPTAPIVNDSCDGNITPVITESADPTCEGSKVYTFTYTDCAGNESVYTYTYTIDVTSVPVVPANAGSTVECIADAVQPAAPAVTDACGNDIVPVITENTDLTCEGSKVYTFTYTDCAGNGSVYTYTYTIDVTSVPVVPANAGSTVECIADAVQPAAPAV
ncbi:PKD domain-containing protein, partial [Confluentibacter citreus]|uniref:PKD domain-containing protein n=1 Tax=Confluentibacter citreus TaxID=2007307 RepID=UPI0012FE54A3